MLLSIALCMSGILSINMPAVLRGVNFLSPIRYMMRNLAPYTLRPVTLTCEASQTRPDGSCIVGSGVEVLALFQLDGNAGLELLGMGVCTLVYRGLAWALLRGVRTRWGEVWGRWRGRGG